MFELSAIEIACGVTVEAVEAAARGALVRHPEDAPPFVALAANCAPAVAGAAARMAAGGALVEFAGLNRLGQPFYWIHA